VFEVKKEIPVECSTPATVEHATVFAVWGRVLKVLLVSLRTGQVSPAGEMSVKWYILEVKKDIPVQYIRENYSA
jgi:hypothetical protein